MASRYGVAAFAAACVMGVMALGWEESLAGTSSAAFEINVTLSNAPFGFSGGASSFTLRDNDGVCTSGAVSGGNSTIIQVLCTVGPFVTIRQGPTASTAGVLADSAPEATDEAKRSKVGPGSPLAGVLAAMTGFNPRLTVGTLTALQVTNATGNSSALEMLVSF